MKESPKRYINPFLSDEENDKLNLFTNVEDEKFEKLLTPSNVPSESLEKVKEFYVDKNVTECELPELIACYEDNGFHVVKDICVDDGVSHEDKIECDKEHHKLLCNPVTVNGDKHDDTIKDDLGTQLVSLALEDSYKNSNLYTVTKDDNVPSNYASNELKLLAESDIVDSSVTFDSDNSMQNGEQKWNNSPNNDVDQPLSKAQSSGSEAEISNETKMEENTISNSDNVKPATNGDPQSVNELLLETKSAPNNDDLTSDNATMENQLQRGGCESSFAITAPVSGLITYSGPISSGGSISHRSDGSNTSVGSFAFPILQNEWNSSPVRMAKMDSRQSRKNGGWRQVFTCCRF